MHRALYGAVPACVFISEYLFCHCYHQQQATWPSGLRRRFKAPVRKGVSSNLTVVNFFIQAQHFGVKQQHFGRTPRLWPPLHVFFWTFGTPVLFLSCLIALASYTLPMLRARRPLHESMSVSNL